MVERLLTPHLQLGEVEALPLAHFLAELPC